MSEPEVSPSLVVDLNDEAVTGGGHWLRHPNRKREEREREKERKRIQDFLKRRRKERQPGASRSR